MRYLNNNFSGKKQQQKQTSICNINVTMAEIHGNHWQMLVIVNSSLIQIPPKKHFYKQMKGLLGSFLETNVLILLTVI